jgi:hypothetical protein
MISNLTKEQEKLVPIYQKKWYNKFHSLEFDEEKAKEFITFLYKNILKKPMIPKIIICDSPYSMQKAINKHFDTNKYYSLDYWGDTSWYGYLAFYDFLYNEVFKEVKIPLFEKYLKLSDSNINALVTFENICFISKPPVFISFDSDNRLHNESDFALYYKDDWGSNYLHGVKIERIIFDKIKNNTITGNEILNIDNAEVKAVIIQTLGFEYIFNDLKNKKIIDNLTEYFNNEKNKPVEYVLFETEINDVAVNLLKVGWYEKNRFRETVLGIPSNIKKVNMARAWTFGMTEEEYFNGDMKYRQGDVLVVYPNKKGGLQNES